MPLARVPGHNVQAGKRLRTIQRVTEDPCDEAT